MTRVGPMLFGVADALAAVSISSAALSTPVQDRVAVSPVYGIAIPEGYRGWELIAPALEDAPFDELRESRGG